MADLAISINQPWAGLIALGLKDVENRDWRTSYRGPVLIHAGLKFDREALYELSHGRHPVTRQRLIVDRESPAFRIGGIVAEAEIVDCVRHSDSSWFVGAYGFVMAKARMTPFRPCRGALMLFTPDFESRYAPKKERPAVRAPYTENQP